MKKHDRGMESFITIVLITAIVILIIGFILTDIFEREAEDRLDNQHEEAVPMKTKESIIRRKATEAFMEIEAGYRCSYEILVVLRQLTSDPVALNLIDEEIARHQRVKNEVLSLLNGKPFDVAA